MKSLNLLHVGVVVGAPMTNGTTATRAAHAKSFIVDRLPGRVSQNDGDGRRDSERVLQDEARGFEADFISSSVPISSVSNFIHDALI